MNRPWRESKLRLPLAPRMADAAMTKEDSSQRQLRSGQQRGRRETKSVSKRPRQWRRPINGRK